MERLVDLLYNAGHRTNSAKELLAVRRVFDVGVDEKGECVVKRHTNCSEHEPHVIDWASPILLMEECGNPVEPSKLAGAECLLYTC